MDVQCELCPKGCIMRPGQSGDCRIRVNIDGKLVAVTYGYPCAVHIDPIEKKPLFHFLPGAKAFSIATAGCNLHCKFCQNWEISQENPENLAAQPLPPEAIPEAAQRAGCRSVAYTYSEPIAYYEYTLDCCIQARQAGLKNLLITAGYINLPPLEKLCAHLDAANIDVKAFSEPFYQDVCGGTLKPVLDALVLTKAKGVLVEVTNLVVPTLNDSDEDLQNLCRWIATYLGRETPLHFSRFFPLYRMQHLPPTPAATLKRAREIAKADGLLHVYVGNVELPGAEDTYCPGCGRRLIGRRQFTVLNNDLVNGACPNCQTKVYGVWN